MIPLLLPPMMKACPLEESYLLLDDLFCQPISYVTVVILTLLLFFWIFCLAQIFASEKNSLGQKYHFRQKKISPGRFSILWTFGLCRVIFDF